MTDKENLLINKLKSSFRDAIIETDTSFGEVSHLVKKEFLPAICSYLKTDPELRFNFISDIIGVDLYKETPRFEVIYQLYSTSRKLRIRLKVRVADGEKVPSVASVWAGADWPEREAYDMFGIEFEGHPDLKRIYLANDWEGFPLRKDYPLRGYKDKYNPFGEEKK